MANMNNQYSNNTRAAWYIIVFMMSMLILMSLLTSCALVHETPYKCELMLRGEQCLSDHRCCKPPQTYYNQTYPSWHWWYWNKPYYNKTIIINKPNNKPNTRPNRPNKPNNNIKKHRK